MVEALVLNLFVPLIVLGCDSSLLLRREVLLHGCGWVQRASSLNLRKCYLSLLDRTIRLRLHFWKLPIVCRVFCRRNIGLSAIIIRLPVLLQL